MTQRARVMLAVHLRDNGLAGDGLVEVARKAIDAAKAGRYEQLLPMPKDVAYRGHSVLPVREIIAVMRLDGFLGTEGYFA